ncbi:MAG: stress response protein [Proteobacteria bacterium SG_bin7]|nr:MAG: stress response protein [Proteobacteria bacterium SG_bin7]
MSIREDHNRFKQIVRGKIKENFKKYITHGEMIGRQEKDFVKIPIPQIDIPRFKYGPKQSGGVGQGQGGPGDAVDGEQGPGGGQAGDTPGEHVLEIDVQLEELADILGEELKLPRIQPKGNKQLDITRIKYSGLSPVGPEGLRHFKASYKEALKRSIASGTYNPEDPIIVPIRRDFRYRSYKNVVKPESSAVVIYMMDVSGSMGDEQKEIVRLESFWINAWLKRHYKGLETRFIIHDASAKEVDEKTFFSTSESGGTLISSAYRLCQKIIDEEYPLDRWNIYPFHFSDGDNWSGEDTRLCLNLMKEFFFPRVNMFGYGQVESKYGSGQFLKDLEREFPNSELLVTSRIPSREKIVDSIKDFLGKGK